MLHHVGARITTLLACNTFALQFLQSPAETFSFDGHEVPNGWALNGWYIFRVYSKVDFIDATGSRSSLPQMPVAEFELAGRATGQYDKAIGYHSLEAAIVYYQDYMDYFDQEHFCKSGSLDPMTSKQSVEWAAMRIPILARPDASIKMQPAKLKVPLNKTGRYLLLLSNCANLTQVKVQGHVQVMNPYGYLPPEQYFKSGPLGFLILVYVLVAAGWIAYGASKKKFFYDVHYYFTGIMVWSILEIAAKLYALSAWNSTASDEPWMSLATILYVLKWIYLYSLAVYIGGGHYDSDSDNAGEAAHSNNFMTASIVCSIYVVVLTVRECIMYQKDSLNLVTSIVLLLSLPMILMDGALALYLLYQTKIEYQKAEAKVDFSRSSIFDKLHKLAIASVLIGTCSTLMGLADIVGVSELSWRAKWLPSEGAAHFVCLGALCCAMYIMRPGMVVKKNMYGKVGLEDEEVAMAVGRADDD
mmetsp:Transcript_26650/g.62163  ORF Transcript_26650/g.62163 Transcript_26650/m.62163 type:complete len:472 (-) Transcript_26650:112-1527(-)|eukprot:CAMPEP_0178370638 /NCGR_PEP_ID=MMETSP0689_2-20121128/412_1 /TAXON_ID=160604 /ORGANISM="Amphidinium massartii, Strain CS-259" /LENGTH=471 /DNA_ID=CAMNT_0019990479 /DNA_START=41 /DNA_END=1456 /DNA_ORIENTATION=+